VRGGTSGRRRNHRFLPQLDHRLDIGGIQLGWAHIAIDIVALQCAGDAECSSSGGWRGSLTWIDFERATSRVLIGALLPGGLTLATFALLRSGARKYQQAEETQNVGVHELTRPEPDAVHFGGRGYWGTSAEAGLRLRHAYLGAATTLFAIGSAYASLDLDAGWAELSTYLRWVSLAALLVLTALTAWAPSSTEVTGRYRLVKSIAGSSALKLTLGWLLPILALGYVVVMFAISGTFEIVGTHPPLPALDLWQQAAALTGAAIGAAAAISCVYVAKGPDSSKVRAFAGVCVAGFGAFVGAAILWGGPIPVITARSRHSSPSRCCWLSLDLSSKRRWPCSKNPDHGQKESPNRACRARVSERPA
jgi:hypothetical protein